MTSRKLLPLVVALLAIALSLEPLAAMSAALCHALEQQAVGMDADVAQPSTVATDADIDVAPDTSCDWTPNVAAAATTPLMPVYAPAATAPRSLHFTNSVSPRTLDRPPPAP